MLPHPDMMRRTAELNYQDQLRDIAQQRRARCAQPRPHSHRTISPVSWLAAVSWLTKLTTCRWSKKRVHVTFPLGNGSERSMHHVR